MLKITSIVFFLVASSLIILILFQKNETCSGNYAEKKFFSTNFMGKSAKRFTVILAGIFFTVCLLLDNINSTDHTKRRIQWKNLKTTADKQNESIKK